MNSQPNHETLKAVLNERAHLLIPLERLTFGNTKLGGGGFGEVCLATLDEASESARQVAIKELRIPLTERERIRFVSITIQVYVPSRLSQIQRLARELIVWAKLKHPNIVELIGYYLDDKCDSALFVSEYMANGNVTQYIQQSSASVEIRLKFVRDIATGLKYLHDLSPPICHGDLKPANVLVNQRPDAVLCDFGISSFIDESGEGTGLTTSKFTKGSTRYMSPELLQDDGSKHTLESDVWAWGCTAFEIMTGILPYSAKQSDPTVMVEICTGSAPGSVSALAGLTMDPAVDPACRAGVSSLQSIIPRCWEREPTRRPSTASVWKLIAIPFQGEGDFGAGKDQEAGTSSPRIGDDSGHQEDETVGRRKPRANPGARKSRRGGSRKGRQKPNDVTETRSPITSSPAHPKDGAVGKQIAEAHPDQGDILRAFGDGPSQEDAGRSQFPEPNREHKQEVPQQVPPNGFREKVPVAASDGPLQEDTRRRQSPEPHRQYIQEVPQQAPSNSFREKASVAVGDGPSQEDTRRPQQFPEPNPQHKQELPQQTPSNGFQEKAPVVASEGPSQEDTRRRRSPEPHRQHTLEAPQQSASNSFQEKAPVVASEGPPQEDTRRRRSPGPRRQHTLEAPQQTASDSFQEKAPVVASEGPSQEDARRRRSPEPHRQHTLGVPQQAASNSFQEKAPVVASEGPSQEDTRRRRSPEPHRQHTLDVPQQSTSHSFQEKAPVVASEGPPQEDTRRRRSPEPHRQRTLEVLHQAASNSFQEKAPVVVVASEGPSEEDARRRWSPEPHQQHTLDVLHQAPFNSFQEKAPVAASDGPSKESIWQRLCPCFFRRK
ncbi:hypothetical protein FRC01_000381 [Tulasnella sp. 417]|nr:hypothetical protein FRC01_000381 [Tulasnella sp. 417]